MAKTVRNPFIKAKGFAILAFGVVTDIANVETAKKEILTEADSVGETRLKLCVKPEIAGIAEKLPDGFLEKKASTRKSE